MPLGTVSRSRRATCHRDLQRFADAVADGVDAGDLRTAGILDVIVLCGHRGQAEQEKAFSEGTSEKHWPDSKHNEMPSRAIDIAPYPIPRNADGSWQTQPFDVLRGYALGVAVRLGIRLRVISWDRPHFELTE